MRGARGEKKKKVQESFFKAGKDQRKGGGGERTNRKTEIQAESGSKNCPEGIKDKKGD